MDFHLVNPDVGCDSIPTQQSEARKHLQRVVRKVRHVLVVKQCIDDLREATLRRASEKVVSDPDMSTIFQDEIDPSELPSCTPGFSATISSIVHPDTPCSGGCSPVIASSLLLDRALQGFIEAESLKETGKRLDPWIARALQGFIEVESLKETEKKLDSWIAQKYLWVQTRLSRSAWLSWAWKRSSLGKDNRAKAILYRLLDDAGHLEELNKLLSAYIEGIYIQTGDGLKELARRLSGIIGFGWFFEWPEGRRPLSTTWPWADVKPSLLVLWGVCWMFPPAPSCQASKSTWDPSSVDFCGLFSESLPNTNTVWASENFYYGTGYQHADNARCILDAASSRQLPYTSCSNPGPIFKMPRRRNYNFQQPYGEEPSNAFSQENISAAMSLDVDFTYQTQLSRDMHVAPESAAYRNRTAFPVQVSDTLASFQVVPVFLPPNQGLQGNQQDFIIRGYPQPEIIMPSSENHYNYPSLDNLSALTDARPYLPNDRDFQIPAEYEQQLQDASQEQPRYPTPPVMGGNQYMDQPQIAGTVENSAEIPHDSEKDSDAPSPGRSKPVPKPDREVTKDGNGKFVCNFPGCTEEVKEFGRKCEWSKHMDKHERPYKCPAEGCEKLPGFTYSGGLLRHEREVHQKHGGPRKLLNCPHKNCKRHMGKGFSRQENLNEHLRRVHTGSEVIPSRAEETEESDAQTGQKRKRATTNPADDIYEEMKRLKSENESLKIAAAESKAQIASMAAQIQQLSLQQLHVQHIQQHQANGHRMQPQPPIANMTSSS